MQQEGFADDLGYARTVAQHLNVDLEVLEASQDILHHFDRMIWHLDEPQADPAPLHVYNICSGARARGIKVLLGGTAGDDLFSGYRRHRALQLEKYYRLTPGFLRSAMAWGGKSLGTGSPLSRRLKKLTAEAGKPRDERMAGYFMWMQQDRMLSLFHPDLRHELKNRIMPEAFYVNRLHDLPPGTDDLNRMLYLEMTTFLPDHNLNYTDKMSMAAGVEGRVPFLDTELVALASRMPVDLKMRGNQTKYILKKVAERYLPLDVIYRPKTGFGAPVRKWIKEDLKPMIDQCLDPEKLRRQGVFDPAAVQELVRLNNADKVDGSYAIWSLLAIESWIRQFIGE
jgi:asparagine synthase (glutamine-hydrolysing)